MYATFAPGDANHLYIAERGTAVGGDLANSTANIRVLDLTTGVLAPTPFLSIAGVNANGEGGLLGLAFHPDYATNGKFYVNLTANDADGNTPFSTYIREYTATPGSATANDGFSPVLEFTQPQENHNGGWIGFSPNDGYLYVMTGDGGGGNDLGSGHIEPGGNAQNTSTLLGKVLRIDVDDVVGRDDFPGDASRNYRIPDANPYADQRNAERVVTHVAPGADEIWAIGLRNPFRAGFDRATGDLWIGDVGQDRREEIDFQSFASEGGEDYGWRLREGKIATPTPESSPVGGADPGAIEPVWDYKRPGAADLEPGDANFIGTTVVGGVPYRGPDPTLQGVYFFTDFGNNRVWTLQRPEGGGAPIVSYVTPSLPDDVGSPGQPSSISEDAHGNIYITYFNSTDGGAVYRIATNEVTPGDFNADATVDGADFAIFRANFGLAAGATRAAGDADGDGDVDGGDYLALQRNLGWSALGAAASTIAAPEPSTACLLAGLVALGPIFRTRRQGYTGSRGTQEPWSKMAPFERAARRLRFLGTIACPASPGS
jgi:glucose/arabinose dehydrogenase